MVDHTARAIAWVALAAATADTRWFRWLCIVMAVYHLFVVPHIPQHQARHDQAVLDRLAMHDWRYGLDVQRASGLRPGAFWAALGRLEADGRIEAMWAEAEPGARGRRRLYRRTEAAG